MQYSWEARYGKEESSRVLGLQFCTLSRCRLPLQLWTADAKFRHLIGEPKPRYLKDDPNQIGAPSSSGTHAVHADLAVSVSILLSVIALCLQAFRSRPLQYRYRSAHLSCFWLSDIGSTSVAIACLFSDTFDHFEAPPASYRSRRSCLQQLAGLLRAPCRVLPSNQGTTADLKSVRPGVRSGPLTHHHPAKAGAATESPRSVRTYRPSTSAAGMPSSSDASRKSRVNEYRQKTIGGRVRKFFIGLFGSK